MNYEVLNVKTIKYQNITDYFHFQGKKKHNSITNRSDEHLCNLVWASLTTRSSVSALWYGVFQQKYLMSIYEDLRSDFPNTGIQQRNKLKSLYVFRSINQGYKKGSIPGWGTSSRQPSECSWFEQTSCTGFYGTMSEIWAQTCVVDGHKAFAVATLWSKSTEDAERRDPCVRLVGMWTGAATMQSGMELLQKITNRATIRSCNRLLSVHLKKTPALTWKDTWALMLTAALLITGDRDTP